jgi:hypothetical protein
MVKQSSDRAAALLDSAGPGTFRPAGLGQRPHRPPTAPATCVEVYESVMGRRPRPPQHIRGFNADATPC